MKFVFLEELKKWSTEKLKDNAQMIFMYKVIQHPHNVGISAAIVNCVQLKQSKLEMWEGSNLAYFVQNSDLNYSLITVGSFVFDHLYGNSLFRGQVYALHHLSKSPLS